MRPPKAKLEAAVKAMRLYLGSVGFTSVRVEQRFYAAAAAKVAAVSKFSGVEYADAWRQIEVDAQRLGKLRPQPAKDY